MYKARARVLRTPDGVEEPGEVVAIKKFKPDKEGEAITYTGISQSACREIMVRHLDSHSIWGEMLNGVHQLNRELHHENLTALREVLLEDKSIYMVFEYAEHDFLVYYESACT